MSVLILSLLMLCAVSVQAAPGDPLTWRDSTWDYRSEDSTDIKSEISVPRLATVVGLTATAYGAAYIFVFAKGWWGDQGSDFHFENDFDYALNLDKFGHFASGVAMGELFYEGYRWAGVSEFNSYLYAGLSAMSTHIAIDIKDGFAPKWGFSIFDVLSGSLGGFLPMAERYVPLFKYVDLKWSYWINSKAYYRWEHAASNGVFTDDYVNQTYWASFKPYRLLPAAARKYYPSWLAIAAGLSIDDGVFIKHYEGTPHREVYIALDYDLEAFRPQSRMARQAIKWLNYFKLPAPTVQVYPEVHWYLLYPIKF
ncbi:MAG: YfiM family protein [Fibrobacter sp.]|nr:YfiM family protein [Fibrobacter sp.]